MSAALGRAQLSKLPAHNARRAENHVRLSRALEDMGFETFLGPDHVERVWFEFLVRHRDENFDVEGAVTALQAEGVQAHAPRYPLLHEQPFFTEGHWRGIARADGAAVEVERPPLVTTARENGRLIRLPNFPGQDNGIIDQYADAFRKVLG